MYEELKIILWPDPRLKKASAFVPQIDQRMRALAARMFELMREARGVGLAAPQVGHNIRLFVMNPTDQPQDDKVYVNPVLSDADGEEQGEEGCLSLPGITANITRSKTLRMEALDLEGRPITETASGYVARIWQHEFDHLNGTLLIDRMGPAARLTSRRVLKELEEQYAAEHGTKLKKARTRH